MNMSQQLLDERHDNQARQLEVGRTYETNDQRMFYVLHVDQGSKPGEFASGRRPAQAKVVYLSQGNTGWREGVPTWILGVSLSGTSPRAIT